MKPQQGPLSLRGELQKEGWAGVSGGLLKGW